MLLFADSGGTGKWGHSVWPRRFPSKSTIAVLREDNAQLGIDADGTGRRPEHGGLGRQRSWALGSSREEASSWAAS